MRPRGAKSMNDYIVAPEARQDIIDIVDYIAADNPRAADRVEDAILEAFAILAERPAMGHFRPDLTPQAYRFWTMMGRYMLVYRGGAPRIEIVRVLGPGRDVAALLGPD